MLDPIFITCLVYSFILYSIVKKLNSVFYKNIPVKSSAKDIDKYEQSLSPEVLESALKYVEPIVPMKELPVPISDNHIICDSPNLVPWMRESLGLKRSAGPMARTIKPLKRLRVIHKQRSKQIKLSLAVDAYNSLPVIYSK